jgi:hypothetical protein
MGETLQMLDVYAEVARDIAGLQRETCGCPGGLA